MKKPITLILALLMTFGVLASGAYASEYTFAAQNTDDFYHSTAYEDMYGSQYNYGEMNLTDFDDLSLLPGILESYPTSGSGGYVNSGGNYGAPVNYYPETVQQVEVPAFTSVDGLTRADGSIGTLSIPSLSINMKAYQGETTQNMNRGLGHFISTSGWDGNIGFCGHNRGAVYTIGTIKNLSVGDTIQYTTSLGTRTYSVTFVGFIAKNDWSYLGQTADNRITLITCLAGQPALRVCVQAAAVK